MDVVRILKGMIEKYNISTEYIEIEITESAYVENGSVIKDTEKAFKNAGFKILIDDFGSGYSSLNMLKDIDADVLKLDMKFLDLNPENNDKGVSIITAVLIWQDSSIFRLLLRVLRLMNSLSCLKSWAVNMHRILLLQTYAYK